MAVMAAFTQERRKMREEMRNVGFLLFLSVATATALALWTFRPLPAAPRARDAVETDGSRRGGEPVPPGSTDPLPAGESSGGAEGVVPTATAVVAGDAALALAPAVLVEEDCVPISAWTWKSLLWKRS